MKNSRLSVPSFVLPLLALVVLSGSTVAQFTQVAEFAGTDWERFEAPNSGPCIQARVFNNRADLCSTDGTSWITTPLGVGSTCSVGPHGLPRLATCVGSSVRFDFDEYTTRFGGWFTCYYAGAAGPATIRFFDGAGILVHEDSFDMPADCSWYWHGWDTGGVQIEAIEIAYNTVSGGPVGMDDLQAIIGASEIGIPFCFCDQSVNCPIPGAYGAGCLNSESPIGSRLHASGNPSVGASSLVLHADYLPYSGPGIFLQGDAALNGGAGRIFGPGLLCITGNYLRLETTFWTGGESANTTVDITSVPGNSILAGQTKYYQLWYREGHYGFCSGPHNLTNALEITWVP